MAIFFLQVAIVDKSFFFHLENMSCTSQGNTLPLSFFLKVLILFI